MLPAHGHRRPNSYAGRPPNAGLRTREAEVERLIAAAKGNRHGYRDAIMLLVAYRHGLRAAERSGRLPNRYPAGP